MPKSKKHTFAKFVEKKAGRMTSGDILRRNIWENFLSHATSVKRSAGRDMLLGNIRMVIIKNIFVDKLTKLYVNLPGPEMHYAIIIQLLIK